MDRPFIDDWSTLNDDYVKDEIEWIAKQIHVINILHSDKLRKVIIKYEDIFDLYLRILGTVAIPLLIVGLFVKSLMDNLMMR